jgi:DNA-binding transcriptional LysR family regulator
MNIRLNDIKNFIQTSSCRTIIQAAQKLEISQPALSESLKRLESDAKIILFYRSRVGIQLTPAGKEFLHKCNQLFSIYNDLDSKQKNDSIFGNQTISIGCHATVAQYSIPKALYLIKEQAPDFKIDLIHDLSRNIQSSVQKGDIDIAVVINPAEVPDLVIHKVSADTVAVWTGSTEDLDHIICNPHLFQTQSILKKWKNKPKKIITTDSLELICKLVQEKIGYGIIPEKAVELSKSKLKRITSLPLYKDEICIIYRPEFGKTTAERLVIDSLKKSILE